MTVGTFRHKGLRRLYEVDDTRGLPPECVRKIKNILTALEGAANLAQVATVPGWRVHPLRGGRRGTYAIRVTGNWRITFCLSGSTMTDLAFEDYH